MRTPLTPQHNPEPLKQAQQAEKAEVKAAESVARGEDLEAGAPEPKEEGAL